MDPILGHPFILAISLYAFGCVGFFVLNFIFMENLKSPSEPYMPIYLTCFAVAAFWPIWTAVLSALLLVGLPVGAVIRLKKSHRKKELRHKPGGDLDELAIPEFLRKQISQNVINAKRSFLVKTKKLDSLLVRYESILAELAQKKSELNKSLEDFEKRSWNDFIRNYDTEIKAQFNAISISYMEMNGVYDEIFNKINKTWFLDRPYYRDRIHEIYNKYDHLSILTPSDYKLEILPDGRIHINSEKLAEYLFGDGRPPAALRRRGEKIIDTVTTVKSDWSAIFTNRFQKSSNKIDWMSQARFQEALESILVDPLTPTGSSKRPLGKNKSGLWRYRLGDIRIVYEPDVKNKHIVFLDIGHRSRIYAD
jgi:mRNA interferase RelE/StbE